MVYYPSVIHGGLDKVISLGDGETITLKWYQAYPDVATNSIAYYIYYSTEKENVFSEGVKYVSIDGSIEANIIDLTPGQLYYFSVRAVEYDATASDLSLLPIAYDNLRVVPSSLLSVDISSTDLIIPLLDITDFPSEGIIAVGAELIHYTSTDIISNTLSVPGDTFIGAKFIDYGGSNFIPFYENVGDGYLADLLLEDSNATTQEWKILCIDGYPDVSNAKFISVGSYDGIVYPTDGYVIDGYTNPYIGTVRDGYSEPYIWVADGYVVNNGIFSFSIVETKSFCKGDYFIIGIDGAETIYGGRGYLGTTATLHTTDGYDGDVYWNPAVPYFISGEDQTYDEIFMCESRFEYPNYPYTSTDGYRQVTQDLLTEDLSVSDEENVDFPMYDYAGYHRTDPVQLLNGTCVGSYIGGEMGCIDKYGNYNMLRGFSVQDHNNQRQEIELSVTGRPAVLIQRMRTGIRCSCFLETSEYPDDRCPLCNGSGFVIGYQQYFNPRRSDGRIMVRPGPADEDVKMTEAGLESEFIVEFWTLTVPTIKDRDILVLYDLNGNEDFRYEVLSVTRNNTMIGQQGGQKIRAQRIRKYDPAYQVRIFSDTSMFPSKLNTTIGMTSGIVPHVHEIVVNENITSLSQINQTTTVSQGHCHQIVDGVVSVTLSHKHEIILP